MLPKFAASFRASTDISGKYLSEYLKFAETVWRFSAAYFDRLIFQT